jgi:hypothetical protein
MAKKNPYARALNTYQSNWNDIEPDLRDEISAELAKGATAIVAVEIVFERHGLSDKLKQWISEACVSAAEKGGVTFTSNLTGRHFFLNKVFAPDGVNLSERVTKLAFQDDVVSTIQANLTSGESFGKLVTQLSKYTTEEDLPKGLLELESMARKVMAGDVESFNAFNKVLNREKSIALRAIDDGNETVLKRSYVRLVNAAERLQEDGLNAAVESAIEKKARAAAWRIADYETSHAYGVAVLTDAKNDEDATGIDWDITEGACEECEAIAEESPYTVENCPTYPAHPHCHCELRKHYGDDVESNKGEVGDNETIPDEMLVNEEE